MGPPCKYFLSFRGVIPSLIVKDEGRKNDFFLGKETTFTQKEVRHTP